MVEPPLRLADQRFLIDPRNRNLGPERGAVTSQFSQATFSACNFFKAIISPLRALGKLRFHATRMRSLH